MAKDTSSMITTSQPRTVPVLDDTGDYAGAAQQFSTERGTEVEAVKNVTTPQRDAEPFDFKELAEDMKSRGYVWCNGRCQDFKHKSEFSQDERNPGRLHCKSYCRECEARRDHRKRTALLPRDVQAAQHYEYRAQKRNRRKKK